MSRLYVMVSCWLSSRPLARLSRLIESFPFVVMASLGSTLLVLLPIYLVQTGDPRFLDRTLTGEEMSLVELAQLVIGLVSMLSLWALSLIHCFIYRSKAIAPVLGVFWPLTIIYAWFVLVQKWLKCSTQESV